MNGGRASGEIYTQAAPNRAVPDLFNPSARFCPPS